MSFIYEDGISCNHVLHVDHVPSCQASGELKNYQRFGMYQIYILYICQLIYKQLTNFRFLNIFSSIATHYLILCIIQMMIHRE
jgi:hypothetical protein